MKRALCALLSLATVLAGLSLSVSAKTADMIDGETSRTAATLYHGVELTKYVLGSASKYDIQEFSAVEFDPSQDDLYLEVAGGGQWADECDTVSGIVSSYNDSNGEGKSVLAAVNGDVWFTPETHSRVEGSGTSYLGCSESVVTNSLTVPRGFTMYGGEIICTTNMVQETPYTGSFYSFGISAAGEALLGDIVCEITVSSKSGMIEADGINRLPADDALVMYTDQGYASNYALDDAYEVVIDTDYDYTVKPGGRITGKVTAVTKPGGEKYPMAENRIILTARGDRVKRLSGLMPGDTVTITTEISDAMGNTVKWQGVTDCVGGHMPIVIDGESAELRGTTPYPTSVLGIKENGNVVMLTSYGRQGLSGYSYGFSVSQLDEICESLGITTAFMLSGGDSAVMTVSSEDGYELTGRPCNKKSDGTFGAEAAVINAVILARGEPKSGGETAEFVCDTSAEKNALISSSSMNAKLMGYSMSLLEEGESDPNVQLFCNDSAKSSSEITARTTGGDAPAIALDIFAQVGDLYSPVNNLYKQVRFESTGEWQTKVIRQSDIDAWYGRIYGL